MLADWRMRASSAVPILASSATGTDKTLTAVRDCTEYDERAPAGSSALATPLDCATSCSACTRTTVAAASARWNSARLPARHAVSLGLALHRLRVGMRCERRADDRHR